MKMMELSYLIKRGGKKLFKEIMLGAGGVVLIAAIIVAIRRFRAKTGDGKVESVYVDELSIGEIKTWFGDKITKETLKGAILYPTPENVTRWEFNIDISHQNNMIIQAVYDEEKDKIIDYRTVLFSTLSAKLKELLDTNGGMLVIEK